MLRKIFYIPVLFSLSLMMILSFTIKDTDLIDWSADRKLTWQDFKSKPETGSTKAALSSIHFGVDFSFSNNDLSWKIYCRFNKNKSWGREKTLYILSHEQAHFDISEVFARKLHKALSEYSYNKKTFQKDLNKMYTETVEEENKMQEAYDKDTNHSINKEKQMEWLENIGKMLNDYKEYAGYQQKLP